MQLPKRPGPYLVIFLLLILVILTAWMFHALNSPVIQDRIPTPEKKAAVKEDRGPSLPPLQNTASTKSIADSRAIDPMHQQMADQMHAEDSTPLRDLELVSEFITLYGKAFGGNPTGDNADITMALTGDGGRLPHLFPPRHRTVRGGQLGDRWGTPYWFHPNSGNQMEIRSAGPDKNLFTLDDVVLNPSPEGLGASLAAPSASP